MYCLLIIREHPYRNKANFTLPSFYKYVSSTKTLTKDDNGDGIAMIVKADDTGVLFDSVLKMVGYGELVELYTDELYIDELYTDNSVDMIDVEDPTQYRKWVFSKTTFYNTIEELLLSPSMQILNITITNYMWLLDVAKHNTTSGKLLMDGKVAVDFAKKIGDMFEAKPLFESFIKSPYLVCEYYNSLHNSRNGEYRRFYRGEPAISTNGFIALDYCTGLGLQIPKMEQAIVESYGVDSPVYKYYKTLPLPTVGT